VGGGLGGVKGGVVLWLRLMNVRLKIGDVGCGRTYLKSKRAIFVRGSTQSKRGFI
jgi:hypothetical protein